MHYSRLHRHGSLDNTRPADWGVRNKHPLNNAWRELARKKDKSRCAEWDDFWTFVKDVGERPSRNHVLSRRDDSAPFSKDNFYWREKAFVKAEDEKDHHLRYMREYRKLHPERMLKYETKRRFGLQAGEYERMLEEQNGVCAICGGKETAIDNRTKQARRLAVDHDHTTGEVRKLLCRGCNTGLGSFKDSPDLLRKAAVYLEQFLNKEQENG